MGKSQRNFWWIKCFHSVIKGQISRSLRFILENFPDNDRGAAWRHGGSKSGWGWWTHFMTSDWLNVVNWGKTSTCKQLSHNQICNLIRAKATVSSLLVLLPLHLIHFPSFFSGLHGLFKILSVFLKWRFFSDFSPPVLLLAVVYFVALSQTSLHFIKSAPWEPPHTLALPPASLLLCGFGGHAVVEQAMWAVISLDGPWADTGGHGTAEPNQPIDLCWVTWARLTWCTSSALGESFPSPPSPSPSSSILLYAGRQVAMETSVPISPF